MNGDTQRSTTAALARFSMVGFVLLLVVGCLFRALFWLRNRASFPDLSWNEGIEALVWGVRFDAAIAAIFTLIAAFAAWVVLRLRGRLRLGWLSVPGLLLLVGLQGGDIMYFAEAGRHISYELRDALVDAEGLWGDAYSRFPLTLLSCLVAMISGGLVLLRWSGQAISARSTWRLEATLFALLLVSIFVIRGGLTAIPLSPISAYNIGDSQQGLLALNGAYSAVRTFFRNELVQPVPIAPLPAARRKELIRGMFPESTSDAMQKGSSTLVSDSPISDSPRRLNVVLIFLESWSADHLASYGYERQTTPFFDALRERSLTAREVLAGGRRTSEGLFAVLCSAQNPLGQTVARSHLQDYRYGCVPDLLRDRGWSTAFFQGTHRDTTGVGAFAQKLGFRHSYGKQQMPPGQYPHNNWGAYDQDLYAFAIERMRAMDQPFLVGVNTNTTHDIQLPPGESPHFPGNSLEDKVDSALYFSDRALEQFFEAYRSDPAFGETLFVLTADHASGAHATRFDHYRIPFLIHGARSEALGHLPVIASQRDIAPTLLELLDIEPPHWFSGRSLMKNNANRYADYFHYGVLGWIEGERRVEMRVTDGELLACAWWRGELNDAYGGWRESPCSADDRLRGERAIAFSDYSQRLLFSGRTRNFGMFD